MRTSKYQKRYYRGRIKTDGLHLTRIVVKETDLQILTDKPIDKDFLRRRINKHRLDIENYITRDKKFLTALKPIEVELNAPLIVQQMAQAAKSANVGPMAAVAGALAQCLGKDLLKYGMKEVIIENGGDIFLKTRQTRKVGIYAGKSKLWKALALKIKSEDTPLGICSSSGTIGHSLSFGKADSAIILSKNAFLADAVATGICNRLQSEADLLPALNYGRSINAIKGIIIIFKNNLASWGKNLEFVR